MLRDKRLNGARAALTLLERRAKILCGGVLVACVSFAVCGRPEEDGARPSSGTETIRATKILPDENRRHEQRHLEVMSVSKHDPRLIYGSVRAEGGSALPDASVCAFETASGRSPTPSCTRTDSSGKFVLEDAAASFELWASARGYSPRERGLRDDADPRTPITFVLSRAAREIDGAVADGTGGRVAGAVVTAWGLEPRRRLARVVTAADGSYSLGSDERLLDLSAEADGYSRAQRLVHAPETGVVLLLTPAATIEGTVVDAETALPLRDVQVVAQGQSDAAQRGAAMTTADGSFRMEALQPGTYVISALSEEWRSPSAWVTLGLGDARHGLTLEAVRGATLSVSISASGAPCPQGRLALQGPLTLSERAGADGVVRIRGLVPGRYAAEVACEPALPARDDFDVRSGEPLERSYDLDGGLSARGRVVGPSGEPIARARVAIQPTARSFPESTVAGAMPHWSVQCTSDDQGEFICPGLTEGAHQCTLLDRPGEVVRFDVSRERSTPLLLRASEAGTIVVRAPGVSGTRMKELVAYAEDSFQQLTTGRAIEAGFAFEHVPLGSYRLYLGPLSHAATQSRSIVLERHGQVAEVEFAPPASASIAGQIVDQRGQPVMDAWVRASVAASVMEKPPAVGNAALTDEHGRFVIERIPVGRYDLEVSSPLGGATLSDVDGGNLQVRGVVVRSASLEGTVETTHGKMLALFDLALTDGTGTSRRVTGSEGHWSLPWLAPGEYTVAVHTESGSAAARVNLAPGEHRSLELRLE